MGLQPFRFGKTDRRGCECGEAGLTAAKQRGTLQKIEHPEAGSETSAARSRQDVVWSCDIVPDSLGRVTAEEDSASVANLLGQCIGAVKRKFQVLGSNPVD